MSRKCNQNNIDFVLSVVKTKVSKTDQLVVNKKIEDGHSRRGQYYIQCNTFITNSTYISRHV